MGLIDLDSNISYARDNRVDDSREAYVDRAIPELNEDAFMYNNALYLAKALFIATGCYQDVVRRTFEANVNSDALMDLTDVVESGQTGFMQISKVANEIIRPSARIDKEVRIVNGWDEPRFRFFLEFVSPISHDTRIRYIYTGFTDYVGANLNGDMDSDMAMHISSVTAIVQTNQGMARRNSRINRSESVVVRSINYSGDKVDDVLDKSEREFTLDPSSVVLHGYGNHLDGNISMYGEPISTANRIGSRARNMQRSLSLPGHYLARIINTRRAATESDEMYDENDNVSMMLGNRASRQTSMLEASSFRKDPLVELYKDDTNVIYSATLHYGDLERYFDNINDPMVRHVRFPTSMRNVSQRTFESELRNAGSESLDADNWMGANMETQLATAIVQQLPNLMMSEFIESIQFTVTNDIMQSSLDDQYHWIIGNDRYGYRDNRSAVVFLCDMPTDYERKRFECFKAKFERLILDPFTMNGQIQINIAIDCDVSGECSVNIEFDGGQEYRFVMPTFADNLSSPLITSDVRRFDDFATKINQVVDEIGV